MGKLVVQELTRPDGPVQDDSCPRTTSPTSAAKPRMPSLGDRGPGNLSVCGHFGKASDRLLYCNACKPQFSEFKGTPRFNSGCPIGPTDAIIEAGFRTVAAQSHFLRGGHCRRRGAQPRYSRCQSSNQSKLQIW
jgi:hypothetical protein